MNRALLLLCLTIHSGLASQCYRDQEYLTRKCKHPRDEKSLCLNMIVKNESAVIRRCLQSVLPFIHRWVIVDTGSTDGTQDIIKNYLKEIPGILYEKEWVDFGYNRSEAYDLVKDQCDYVLFVDADDKIEVRGDFPDLDRDVHHTLRGSNDFVYVTPQIIRGDLPCRWIGVAHEYLHCPPSATSSVLDSVRYVSIGGGARSKGIGKFKEYITLFEKALETDPDNERHMFYLAESYRDAGNPSKALEIYQKRINMGGWDEEIFWSKLQIAIMLQRLGLSPSIIIAAHQDAHQYRLHRSEPVYYMAELYAQQGRHQEAYSLLEEHEKIEKPSVRDRLFVMSWIDRWGLSFQKSISSYYVGKHEESLRLCDNLLRRDDLPDLIRIRVTENRRFSLPDSHHRK